MVSPEDDNDKAIFVGSPTVNANLESLDSFKLPIKEVELLLKNKVFSPNDADGAFIVPMEAFGPTTNLLLPAKEPDIWTVLGITTSFFK